MTKADIVDTIATATGLTKVETEAVVDGFISTVINAMKEGKNIEIRGFGSYKVKKRKGTRRPESADRRAGDGERALGAAVQGLEGSEVPGERKPAERERVVGDGVSKNRLWCVWCRYTCRGDGLSQVRSCRRAPGP